MHSHPLPPPKRKNILGGCIFSAQFKLFESVRFPSMGIIIVRINASEPSINRGNYKSALH